MVTLKLCFGFKHVVGNIRNLQTPRATRKKGNRTIIGKSLMAIRGTSGGTCKSGAIYSAPRSIPEEYVAVQFYMIATKTKCNTNGDIKNR